MHWFTFHLPVKTYIKKYLVSNYGDPILIDLKEDIGFIILNILASRLESKMCRGYLDLWENRYNDKITFRIPFHYFSITKKEVQPTTYVLLNRYFENKFEEEMYQFVNYQKLSGTTTKKSIELFTGKFGIDIDIDISSDAMKKAEYRYRKRITEKSSRNLSPAQNLLFRA